MFIIVSDEDCVHLRASRNMTFFQIFPSKSIPFSGEHVFRDGSGDRKIVVHVQRLCLVHHKDDSLYFLLAFQSSVANSLTNLHMVAEWVKLQCTSVVMINSNAIKLNTCVGVARMLLD
jgi:hypothetical protein